MADTIDKKDVLRRPGLGAKPQGSGFTNIQKIIGANQGNKIGSTVVGGIQQVGQQAKQGLDQATNQFTQDVNANRLDTDQNKAAAAGLLKTAGVGGDLNADQLNQAKTFREGQFQGPTDIKNVGALAGRAAEAEQLGKFGSSEGGRQGLLQRFVGAPQYNQGQQRLDGLLLGADSKAINQARSATQGLADQSARQIQGARAQGQEAVQGAQQFGQTFLNTIKGKNQAIDSDIDAQTSAAQAAENTRQQNFDALNTALNARGNLLAGVKAPDVQNIINTSAALNADQKANLSKVIAGAKKLGLDPRVAVQQSLQSQAAQGLDRDQVMSSNDVAKINALRKLAGGDEYTNANAGTFQAGSNSADPSKANAALDSINRFKVTSGANANIPGANDKGLLKEIVTSPDKSWQNPNAVKQLLTPDEFQLYEYANGRSPTPPANWKQLGGIDAVKNKFKERANENLARLDTNEKTLAAKRAAFNKGTL